MYIYMYVYIYVCIYSITDMCCCQLASAVAHLLPALTSSCLCFVAPKQGPDSGPQKWGHNTKISSPASKCVFPILGPWCMRFAFCKERVELRQVASSIHVFLRLVPGCWFHMQGTQWRKAKSMQAHSPKNGSVSQRKPKERFKRGRDASVVLQQTWLPQAMPRHAYRQRQYTGPWAQPPAPPDIKVDLLPHSAKLHQERQQD